MRVCVCAFVFLSVLMNVAQLYGVSFKILGKPKIKEEQLMVSLTFSKCKYAINTEY